MNTNIKVNISALKESAKNTEIYRKENKLDREIVALDPKTGRAVVTIRTYWPGETCYCMVWVQSGELFGRGCGKATGYGYHKRSAAVADAMKDAGIELSECISGRGDSLIESAALAVARAATGKRRFIIHTAYA